MQILVVAGGSGGHIFPAVAVAKVLRARGHKLMLVGSRSTLDGDLLKRSGLPFRQITCGKLRRYFDWQTFLLPWQILVSLWQSWRLLRQVRPAVVFSKGGFVAVPICLVAAVLRVPIVTHESDAAIGLANRITARLATRRLSAWKLSGCEQVGLPLRTFTSNTKSKLLDFSDKHKPLLFGFFGSQGSAPLNELFFPIITKLAAEANIIWAVGANNLHSVSAHLPANVHCLPFLHEDFGAVLSAADLVVTRAGSSVFELAAAGKAAVLIPLPSAANNHQWHNADQLRKAALVLDQRTLTPNKLCTALSRLLHSKKRRDKLAMKLVKLHRAGAAERIADFIELANIK